MKTRLISAVLSLAFSLALLSGNGELHQFAFYVTLAMHLLGWALLLGGQIKGEVAAGVRNNSWFNLPYTALSLYALIVTGHTILAASSFMLSMFILIVAHEQKKVPV